MQFRLPHPAPTPSSTAQSKRFSRTSNVAASGATGMILDISVCFRAVSGGWAYFANVMMHHVTAFYWRHTRNLYPAGAVAHKLWAWLFLVRLHFSTCRCLMAYLFCIGCCCETGMWRRNSSPGGYSGSRPNGRRTWVRHHHEIACAVETSGVKRSSNPLLVFRAAQRTGSR